LSFSYFTQFNGSHPREFALPYSDWTRRIPSKFLSALAEASSENRPKIKSRPLIFSPEAGICFSLCPISPLAPLPAPLSR
jgi:hypothetical protein